jgi:hypothetical protein
MTTAPAPDRLSPLQADSRIAVAAHVFYATGAVVGGSSEARASVAVGGGGLVGVG